MIILHYDNEAKQSKSGFVAVVNRLARINNILEAERVFESYFDLWFKNQKLALKECHEYQTNSSALNLDIDSSCIPGGLEI